MKYFLSSIIIAISGWLIAANVHDLSVDSSGNMTAISKDGSSSKHASAEYGEYVPAITNTGGCSSATNGINSGFIRVGNIVTGSFRNDANCNVGQSYSATTPFSDVKTAWGVCNSSLGQATISAGGSLFAVVFGTTTNGNKSIYCVYTLILN